MEELGTVRLTKEEAKTVRWIQKGVSTDDTRPALCAVYIDGEKMVSTNGFRLHIAPTPEVLQEYNGKCLDLGKVPAQDCIIAVHEITNGSYPEYEAVIPAQDESELEISFNSQFMIEFLQSIPKGTIVKMNLKDGNNPLVLSTEEDAPRFGIIMPTWHRKGTATNFYDPR